MEEIETEESVTIESTENTENTELETVAVSESNTSMSIIPLAIGGGIVIIGLGIFLVVRRKK